MGDDRFCFRRRARCGALGYVFWTLLILVPGCGQETKLGHVYGTVRLDGKPVTNGSVRFVPDAGRAATGNIESDGTYRLGTYSHSDGALIGTHKVAIIAYEAGGDSLPAYKMRNQRSKPLIPERYMAVGTSRLTFEVKPGDNPADFDLSSR